jgi:hypothetical protein
VDGHGYTVTDDSPVAPLPGWIAGLLVAAPARGRDDLGPLVEAIGCRSRYAAAAMRAELDLVLAAHPGSHQRNHTLNKAAFALGQLVRAGLLPASLATAALAEASAAISRRARPTGRSAPGSSPVPARLGRCRIREDCSEQPAASDDGYGDPDRSRCRKTPRRVARRGPPTERGMGCRSAATDPPVGWCRRSRWTRCPHGWPRWCSPSWSSPRRRSTSPAVSPPLGCPRPLVAGRTSRYGLAGGSYSICTRWWRCHRAHERAPCSPR